MLLRVFSYAMIGVFAVTLVLTAVGSAAVVINL